jgi:hypothetical protein
MAAMTAVDIFRIFGGVLDDCLLIPDILSRLGTSKEVWAEPSDAAAVLMFLKKTCDDRQELGEDAHFMPTVRHLIGSSRRPLTTARANEIIEMVDALCNYAVGDGMLSRIENGEDLESMNESSGGEDTAWDEVVVKLRSWVMAMPGCTHVQLEDHLESLLADWKAEQVINGHAHEDIDQMPRARVYDPYPWATDIDMGLILQPWSYTRH